MDDWKYDDKGLIVAVAQDVISGEIRMVAWMNRDAIQHTLASGKATFYSRSRGKLWTKGETSGNTLQVSAVYIDCDTDTLLLHVLPAGPSCHTGRPTCFFNEVLPGGNLHHTECTPGTFVQILEREILARQGSDASKSYTSFLLNAGVGKVGEKIREEAGEFADAIAKESEERVANEAADVLYHLLVGLRARDVSWRQVIEVLAARAGQSGIEEKANRAPKEVTASDKKDT